MPDLISAPGVYDLPASRYHADPCAVPSLSSTIGKWILKRSPRHGAVRHPKITRKPIRDEKDSFDLGSAAHAVLLGEGRDFEIVDKPNWQGNVRGMKSAEFKTKVRAAGKIPILKSQYGRTKDMVGECRRLLPSAEAAEAFDLVAGKAEKTIIWREGDVWCRAMLDWMPNVRHDRAIFYDYKTTAGSAHPDDWGGKTGWGIQFDFQAAFYLRGIRSVLGLSEPRMRFIVQELEEPHELCCVELTAAALAMANRKVEHAIELWRQCHEADHWPGYTTRVCYVEPPAYEEANWLAREEREPMDAHMIQRITDWRAPL